MNENLKYHYEGNDRIRFDDIRYRTEWAYTDIDDIQSDDDVKVRDDTLVTLFLEEEYVELWAYLNNINEEKQINIYYRDVTKDSIGEVSISLKYKEAKLLLEYLGYELYEEESKATYLDRLYSGRTYIPFWCKREIWTKKENITPFRFKD